MATSSEIEAALVGRVNAILSEKHGIHKPAVNVHVAALCQALAELMGDDEDQRDPAE